MRVCLLMSDLEQAEHGSTGRGREWLARATRAPRDPAWIADGIVSDQWAPISPVTGRLDAFVWQAPPDVLVAPELAMSDDVTADLDDHAKPLSITVADAPPEPPPPVEPAIAADLPPEESAQGVEAPVTAVVKHETGEEPREGPPAPRPEPVVFPVTPPDVPKPREAAPARRGVFSIW
jgi:HemY protein